jgi:MoaA/NifB/PqqE/SkfB family radical SAM enzyme
MRRISRFAYQVARSNFIDLPLPYRLTFSVTNRCQARCIMCNIWQKPVEHELSLDEIHAIFRRADKFSWINLTGGELFLREDHLELILGIAKQCRNLYLLNFPTNGFLTETIVGSVRAILARTSIPRLMVSVSLDGPPELHDRIRNLPGSWQRAMATFQQLRELRSRRFSVFLGFTIQSATLHAFDDMMSAAQSCIGELSVDDVHLNVAHVSGHYYANSGFSGIPDPEETGRLLDRIHAGQSSRLLDPVAFLERRYRRIARAYRRTGFAPLTCQAAAASCFIDPEGNVAPCSGYAAPIGSLRENDYDLYRLWRSSVRRAVRATILDGSCPGCWTPCEAYQTILANLTSC